MVYILPGMGASSKMYLSYKPWTEIEGVRFLDWPSWSGERTLNELALRLIEDLSITGEDLIAGSSLGGMIALEIAKTVQAKKAILIGGAVSSDEVSRILIKLAPLSQLAPIKFIQLLCGKYNSSLIQMFTEVDAEFIKYMCVAIKEWKGAELYSSIERIHGDKDLVIPCPLNAKTIKGGGHLIAMTHPEQCSSLFKTMIQP